jgi:hypothetical protein
MLWLIGVLAFFAVLVLLDRASSKSIIFGVLLTVLSILAAFYACQNYIVYMPCTMIIIQLSLWCRTIRKVILRALGIPLNLD